MSRHTLKASALLWTTLAMAAFGQAPPTSNQQATGDAPAQATSTPTDKGATAPASASTEAPKPDKEIRPASFQNVTPGKTSMADLLEQLGEPLEQSSKDDVFLLTYKIGPFPKVTFEVIRNVTEAIIIQLAEPTSETTVARDLGLDKFQPITVKDDRGRALGVSFPERAVVLKYKENGTKVTEIILDQIGAEPFVLRAESRFYEFQSSLQDLVAAIKVDPLDPTPKWHLAKLNYLMGTQSAALKSIQSAIKAEDRSEFRLLLVRILTHLGETVEANRIAQAILNNPQALPLHRAEAYNLVGDLMQIGPQADFAKALQHHQKAIEVAKPLAVKQDPFVRKAAKYILLEAHLGVALDIAQGNWADKEKVLPKWLANAKKLCDSLIEKDLNDPAIKMHMLQRALEAHAYVEIPCNDLAAEAIEFGRELVAKTKDPLRKRFIERHLGHGLRCALLNARKRKEHKLAAQFGQDAVALLSALHSTDPSDVFDTLTIAELHFEMGSLLAIGAGEHEEAMKWYNRAIKVLADPKYKRHVADLALHGERFVSVGVSAWETGQKDLAIELTEKGVGWIEEAIALKKLDKDALVIPYGNLVQMHKHMGNTQRAKTLAGRVDEIKKR